MEELLVIARKSAETNSTSSYPHKGVSFALCLAAIVVVSLASVLTWPDLTWCGESSDTDRFPALKARLIEDGLDRNLVESLYSSSQVSFDPKVVSVYFLHREAKLNYDQFLSRSSIDKTVEYFNQHEKTLERVEKEYGVDGEVICAIILVETRFGKVVGSRLVINTLSTLADLHEKETRDGLWDAHLDGKAKESKRQFESWAARKSTWAYAELRAYLAYVSGENLDPLAINGSFAGALGIAQFIPSSVQQYAKDGNEDGQVNLFHHEDAIESIGNYLKQHGWHKSVSRDEAFQIILKYNNSKYYAKTILRVAELVEERRKALRAAR